MAQQHHQQHLPPQRTYSPLPRTDSPQHGPPGPYPPPIKRQALSPNNQSPYGSPGMANIQLPNQVFSAPYYGAPTNGNQPYPPYNPNHHYGSPGSNTSNPNQSYGNQTSPGYSPNYRYSAHNIYGSTSTNGANNYNTMSPAQKSPPAQSGSARLPMGPPERPSERPSDKPTDINELGDVMVGSGIDLREEEAALLSSYGRPGQQQQATSYGSHSSHNYGPSYVPPTNNFYSHNVPGDRASFYGAGTFNQRPMPEQSAEQIAAENRKRAARSRAEIRSYHLNNPFLSIGSLLRMLSNEVNEMQVIVPRKGSTEDQPGPSLRQIVLKGTDRNEGLKAVLDEGFVQTDDPLVEILSLLSLAAEERLRGVVEDAATLAKGRRINSHGRVPLEMADLAAGNAASEVSAGLPTPEDSASSPKANPLKRSYSEVNKTSTPASADNQARKTIANVNPVIQILQREAEVERAQEVERLEKRARRAAAKGNEPGPASTGTPSSSGTLGEVAPEPDTKKSGKAKDKMDEKAKKALETQQHAATTKTANMALGLSGAMGKKLSWMKGGADATPSNPYKQTPKSDAFKAGGSGASAIGSNLPKVRIFGQFREDRETGAGIQLRDVIHVLENDRKERKSLQRAYHRQGSVGR